MSWKRESTADSAWLARRASKSPRAPLSNASTGRAARPRAARQPLSAALQREERPQHDHHVEQHVEHDVVHEPDVDADVDHPERFLG
jgi:hypothetical protein